MSFSSPKPQLSDLKIRVDSKLIDMELKKLDFY